MLVGTGELLYRATVRDTGMRHSQRGSTQATNRRLKQHVGFIKMMKGMGGTGQP